MLKQQLKNMNNILKTIVFLVSFICLLGLTLSIYQNMNLYDSMRSNQFYKTRYDVDVLKVIKNYDDLHAWNNNISLHDLIICTLKDELKYLDADYSDIADKILYLDVNKKSLLDQIESIEIELSEYLQKKEDTDCFNLYQDVDMIRKQIEEEKNL